ncbi:LysM peptidoglycan-binding domain-containing protein [Nostoc sp. UHCC 0302]|uniref:LysM peptidoglycan-binding domain-containing protein n=1 Tax=Nostoc sp. UHCC 0302 TaxID=3134896 RepID=UPI00311CA088
MHSLEERNEVKPGDVVYLKTIDILGKPRVKHYGIVAENTLFVYHFVGKKISKGIFRKTRWERFATYANEVRKTHVVDISNPDLENIVLARAKILVNLKPMYDWHDSNCENAVRWCKTGKWQSLQVRDLSFYPIDQVFPLFERWRRQYIDNETSRTILFLGRSRNFKKYHISFNNENLDEELCIFNLPEKLRKKYYSSRKKLLNNIKCQQIKDDFIEKLFKYKCVVCIVLMIIIVIILKSNITNMINSPISFTPVNPLPPDISPVRKCHSPYKVKPRDTLTHIAFKCYGDSTKSDIICKANRDKIKNCHNILTGIKIVIP